MKNVAINLEHLQKKIHRMALNCGRNPSTVKLMAVSKKFPIQQIETALVTGQKLFGENRVQEAEEKILALANPDMEWHLIGPLQSNKAARAVEIFDVIQTLDRTKIAKKVNDFALKSGKTMKVFIEVNIGEEPQKHGVSPTQIPEMVRLVDNMQGLDLLGLMAIPPHHSDPECSRPYFRKLARTLTEINRWRDKPLEGLSMGMSHDYQVAIEEGSTLIRIGTAIFGTRVP